MEIALELALSPITSGQGIVDFTLLASAPWIDVMPNLWLRRREIEAV